MEIHGTFGHSSSNDAGFQLTASGKLRKTMNEYAHTVLQRIGRQLDRDIFPSVKNGGLVTPSESAVPSTLGAEKYHASRQQRRPEGRPWEGKGGGQWPVRRSWPSRRPWSARQTTPLVSRSLQARYEDQLDAIRGAYPDAQVWQKEDGLWLLTESRLLPGLRQTAIFLTGLSYTAAIVHGWGFWSGPLSGPTWIGPRHTNFPIGSICAFHPSDGTWIVGDPIVELLDLYTLWALRHLHLEVFGRWPGPQAVLHPYERLIELKEDECCGCGEGSKVYRDCCRDRDMARNRVADAVDFVIRFAGGLREPPHSIRTCIRERSTPPPFADLFVVSMQQTEMQ